MTKYTYIVPHWAKAAFFWLAVTLAVLLVGMQIHKRWLFAELLVENALRPEPSALGKAPDFELAVLPGESKTSLVSAAAGKYTLIHFWATWCPPCRTEMPSLEMMAREFKGRLSVLAVSVDDNKDAVGRFFGDHWPELTVLWDPGKAVARQYGAERFPESFLMDPQGLVLARFGGQREWSSTEALSYLSEVLNGTRKAIRVTG